METGIWANFHWESGIWVTGTGFWSLGMGITDRKTIELGLGFLKFEKQKAGKWDLGKIWAGKMGFITPLQDPLESIGKTWGEAERSRLTEMVEALCLARGKED